MTGRLSFAGQMAIVLAIALLAAQAVNFVLLLEARKRENEARLQTTIDRVVTLLETVEDIPRLIERRNMRRRPPFAITITREPLAPEMMEIEPLSEYLEERLQQVSLPSTGARVSEVMGFRAMPPDRKVMIISVPGAGDNWYNFTDPVRFAARLHILPLIIQTILIYIGLLAAVLFVTARLANPLRQLTQAADTFSLDQKNDPLSVDGPKDVRQLTAAFERMQSRLQRAFKEKDVMLGAIGHDLRTPLTSLRIRVEQVEDDAVREKMSQTIEDLSLLLDDILTLARDGAPGAERELIFLPSLLDMVREELKSEEGSLSLGRIEDLTLDGYPALLRRAVRNLSQNGLRYGGAVTLHLYKEDNGIFIAVEDDGPGVSEATLEQMREPFIRGEESRNRATGGAGLGLAIADGAARTHGGELILENRPQGGFRAALKLPVATS